MAEGTAKKAGIACFGVLFLIGAILVLVAIIDGYHEIEEGHVGVYFKFGAL